MAAAIASRSSRARSYSTTSAPSATVRSRLARGASLRHDDHARHAEEPRRRRDALRVIAGRERDHAAGALFGRHRRELVVGAAELERAGALQGFGFEKNAAAGHGVERGRGQKRRVQRDAGEPARRLVDVGGGRQGYRRVHTDKGSAAIASRARASANSVRARRPAHKLRGCPVTGRTVRPRAPAWCRPCRYPR